jgi:TRAP transporter TAXI family solute receptor
MDQLRWNKVAAGAGFAAVLVAVVSGRWPRWVRIALVVGLVAIACSAGFFAYSYVARPTTLTVAAGSVDGDAFRLMSAIAARLTSTGSPIRLKVFDKGTALDAVKAFSAGEVDLATARADIGDLSSARTVVIVANAVVLIVVPPGSSITSIDDLKGRTVGVLGIDLNRRVVEAISKEYDLDAAKTRFRDIALKDVPQSIQSKQISALLVVRPITEKYLAMVRDLFPHRGKTTPGLVAIESAGAIAAVDRPYESYELPKGTIQGSPPVPDEDLTTLRVPFYLVANKNLDSDVIATLTQEVMESRRDLLTEYPLLAQVSAPSTDRDAYIPIHPGAAAYFNGEQHTFFDKYGDQIFYGSMVLGCFDLCRSVEIHLAGRTCATRTPVDAPLRAVGSNQCGARRSGSDGRGTAYRQHSQGRIARTFKWGRQRCRSCGVGVGDPSAGTSDRSPPSEV